jgi:undecaprenyl-diphosphatase
VLLTDIGRSGLVWIAFAVVFAVVRRRPVALVTIPVVFLADLISLAIKAIVGRHRPNVDPLVHTPTDWSFPSGHATTSFAGATMLSFFVPRLAPAFYLLATAIAFSRVYVGVHYPTDVLAGAALGTAVGWAGITSLRRLERSPRQWPRALRRG